MTRRGGASPSQIVGCNGIPNGSGCLIFGCDASLTTVAIHAGREKLAGLAGHRDPVHVHTDIPIFTIGVAVVTRLAARSHLPCPTARIGTLRGNRRPALVIA